MVVLVMVVAVAAARVFPTDPVGAIGAVLALPDRHAVFDAIDQGATGLEGFGAVGRAGGANDGASHAPSAL